MSVAVIAVMRISVLFIALSFLFSVLSFAVPIGDVSQLQKSVNTQKQRVKNLEQETYGGEKPPTKEQQDELEKEQLALLQQEATLAQAQKQAELSGTHPAGSSNGATQAENISSGLEPNGSQSYDQYKANAQENIPSNSEGEVPFASSGELVQPNQLESEDLVPPQPSNPRGAQAKEDGSWIASKPDGSTTEWSSPYTEVANPKTRKTYGEYYDENYDPKTGSGPTLQAANEAGYNLQKGATTSGSSTPISSSEMNEPSPNQISSAPSKSSSSGESGYSPYEYGQPSNSSTGNSNVASAGNLDWQSPGSVGPSNSNPGWKIPGVSTEQSNQLAKYINEQVGSANVNRVVLSPTEGCPACDAEIARYGGKKVSLPWASLNSMGINRTPVIITR